MKQPEEKRLEIKACALTARLSTEPNPHGKRQTGSSWETITATAKIRRDKKGKRWVRDPGLF